MPDETRIAIPIVSNDPPLAAQIDAAIAAGADLLELRVDRIDDIPAIEATLRRKDRPPIILTIRSADEGGAWSGSDAERIALIEHLGLLQPGYVDVELATWQRSANLRQKIRLVCECLDDTTSPPHDQRPKNKLILSHHNFRNTPANLDEPFDTLESTPAGILKAVFTPRDTTDALRILVQLGNRANKRHTIALAMGESGLITRVLARKFRAFLTFATRDESQQSAPGQPTIQELCDRFRWTSIGRNSRVFGVVGWPISHSQSPSIHNAAMATAGMDGVYLPMPVQPTYDDFVAFMTIVAQNPALDIHGLSVTIPHKLHALRWVDEQPGSEVTPLARSCGAVNTLARRDDNTWLADNTDAVGIIRSLERIPRLSGDRLRGKRVAVIGAGGVARAAVAALAERGCAITVYNRSGVRAEELADDFGCETGDWHRRNEVTADILIQCTSVGMWPETDAAPVTTEALREGMIVFETIYRPQMTKLLRMAKAVGCELVDGVGMFIEQAAAQFTRWHDTAPDREVMQGQLVTSD